MWCAIGECAVPNATHLTLGRAYICSAAGVGRYEGTVGSRPDGGDGQSGARAAGHEGGPLFKTLPKFSRENTRSTLRRQNSASIHPTTPASAPCAAAEEADSAAAVAVRVSELAATSRDAAVAAADAAAAAAAAREELGLRESTLEDAPQPAAEVLSRVAREHARTSQPNPTLSG